MIIDFITSNEHKFREINAFLSKGNVQIRWIREKYEEIQENTTESISKNSAEKLSLTRKEPFFIEDTGLYIDSLGGFPGPYSAYVSGTIGNSGILNLLQGKERSANFLTVVAYWDGKSVHTFSGKIEGKITDRVRGNNGFGYDPIFQPDGSEMTLAEMEIVEKNKNSHRILALKKFLLFLKSED